MQQKLNNEIIWATITAKLAGTFILYSWTGTLGTEQGIQSWEGRLPREFRCGIFINLESLFYNWHQKIIIPRFTASHSSFWGSPALPSLPWRHPNLVPPYKLKPFLWAASLHPKHLPSISIFKTLLFSQENLISVSSSDIVQPALPRSLCEHTGVSAWILLVHACN